MTLRNFRIHSPEPGHDGQLTLWPTTGPAEITVYYRLGFLPSRRFWSMVASLGDQARVTVVFRRWGREWFSWAGPGSRASFFWTF